MSVSSPLLGSYDEPEILPYQITLNCPTGADDRQLGIVENSQLHALEFSEVEEAARLLVHEFGG